MLRHLPNLLSGLRILLAVPIALALIHRQPITTLWLFGFAAVSDAFDGWIARRFGWQTELGGMLDAVVDKLMMATVFVVLTLLGEVPVWLTTAVLARDCLIVLGAVAYRMLVGAVRARPSKVSKCNTLCQVIFILWIVGVQHFAWPHLLTAWLGALVFVTVVVSGLDYVLVYGRLAVDELRARDAAPERLGA